MVSSILITLLLINTIFFGILTIRSFLTTIPKKYESISRTDTAIVSINFVQYLMTFILECSEVLNKDAQKFAQQLRVVNSLLTSPMVMYTYWKLAQIEGYPGDLFWLIALNFIIVLVNILSEIFPENSLVSWILFGVGISAYIILMILVVDIMKYFTENGFTEKCRLGAFVLFGLSVFPISYFLPFEAKYILFCISDFIVKGIYPIKLGAHIRSNL